MTAPERRQSLFALFLIFLRLGLTSFCGPIAHLGYFRTEFVERRRWLDQAAYGQVVALCQFLPGPASSQVGIAIGLLRGGVAGAALAWLGFTMPSALLMIGFAYAAGIVAPAELAPWLHGLLIVAVAVVAQAVWTMARSLAPDRPRATLAIVAAALTLAVPTPGTTLAILAGGGLIGWRMFRAAPPLGGDVALNASWPRSLAWAAAVLFFALLLLLPLAARLSGDHAAQLFDRFYRVGALVFGGGHVVLPLLQQVTVPPGWITQDAFLAGYGAAQAVPGPLFTFAGYLGAAMTLPPHGWQGGLLCLFAIFLPSFLMVAAMLPLWQAVRGRTGARAALAGINAAVVGILLAALYDPVWVTAIHGGDDFILALAAFAALQLWRLPPWSVVLATALAARLAASFG